MILAVYTIRLTPSIAAIQQLISDVSTIVGNSPELQAIPGDIKRVFSDFSLLVTNPSDFVTHSFDDIITLISDIAVSLVQFTDAVVESLVKMLQGIVNALTALVAKQTINIPVLTDLYSLITKGSQLTLLDLCSLIVAVPTTIISKALNSATQVEGVNAPRLGVVLTENIGYVLAVATYAVIDGFMDATEPNLPMKGFYMGLSTLIQGLNFPTDLASNTAGTYIFYAATAVPLVLTAVDIKNSTQGANAAFKASWEGAVNLINPFYGFIMVATSLSLGITNQQFQGKDYLLMLQNIFSFVPFTFKPLGQGGEPSKIALGVIDGVCDFTAMGLGVAQW